MPPKKLDIKLDVQLLGAYHLRVLTEVFTRTYESVYLVLTEVFTCTYWNEYDALTIALLLFKN